MAEQSVNPEESKLEDEMILNKTAQKHIDLIAEKAAEKGSKTEQNFDRGSNDLFKVK
jgi:hypothetical protein